MSPGRTVRSGRNARLPIVIRISRMALVQSRAERSRSATTVGQLSLQPAWGTLPFEKVLSSPYATGGTQVPPSGIRNNALLAGGRGVEPSAGGGTEPRKIPETKQTDTGLS